MISFKCAQCGTGFRVTDDKAGKKGGCPKCGAITTIPAPNLHSSSAAPSPTRPSATAASQQVENPPRSAFSIKPKEALDWFRSKKVVSPAEFKMLDAAGKARAFSVSGLTDMNALKLAKEVVAKAIEDGLPTSQFMNLLEERFAAAGLGTDDLSLSDWRTVYEDNASLALSVGHAIQAERVKDSRPYFLFWNPDPETPICILLEGKVFRADDPWCRRYAPPFHSGCKTMRLTLDQEEVDAEGLTVTSSAELDIPPIAEGFDFNPGAAG